MTQYVDISLRVPGTTSIPNLIPVMQEVEAAGFDGAGILDSQLLCRDVFVTMGAAAVQTSRMTLFSAVTNPFSRHASVLASAMQTVEELAPGRMKCIIGTGYTSASTIGRKPGTLAQMRDTIRTMRALLAGETVDFNGTPGKLDFASGRDIPIIMAASGPKSIELAGEVADGVLVLVGFTPGIVKLVLERLERGAKRSGRRLDDLEIIWAVRTGTASTTAEARRQARPTAVHWGILGWGNHWLQQTGPKLPEFDIPPAVWEIYPDLAHAPDWEAAIDATSFVPDDVIATLCDALGLIGTPDYCAERIMEMTQSGVSKLYIMPLQTFVGPEQDIRAFREVIFPRLQAAGYH
ncbi:MAG: LLM class flavin-dependent oxidoreductase [Candidatus Tectomicrobia bacterium]|nr:LLM class flavin-dependent oxidoreductase [Candidatus Tectomicrobia bacterium]